MKICPNCGASCPNDAAFCTRCGNVLGAYVDVFDHTAEFDAKDVSDNKVYAMLCYLTGVVGVIIALLAGQDSAYAKFHIRQIIKFTVVEALVGILMAILCWTILVPIAGALFLLVLAVIKIICFFRVCAGKSIEPAIIRSMGFLK